MGRGGYFSSAHSPGPRKGNKAAAVHQLAGSSIPNAQTNLFEQHSALNVFPPSETMALSQFPVVYNDGQQDRLTGLLPLGPSTTWGAIQQQLVLWLGLPIGTFQVMLACSRASDHDQVQKIPVHEGTNFSVLLTRHNPSTDDNAHFIVQPKVITKGHAVPTPALRRELHDDDVLSRASSASSSPRYPAALMAQVAAAMAAAGNCPVGSPTGSSIQSFLLAQQAQQQRAQQAQQAQQMQHRQALLSQSQAQSLGGQIGGYAPSVVGPANGLRLQNGGTSLAPRTAYAPQRNVTLPLHGNIFTPQGMQTQMQVQGHLYKHATVAPGRMRQSVSSSTYQQQQPLQQQQQQRLVPLGSSSRLQPQQYVESLSPMAAGMENYLPSSLMGACDMDHINFTDPWCKQFNSAATPATLRNNSNSVGVPSFPDGMLAEAHEMGAGQEATFWRVSPRDDVVEGFKGVSPFGPIGPIQYYRG